MKTIERLRIYFYRLLFSILGSSATTTKATTTFAFVDFVIDLLFYSHVKILTLTLTLIKGFISAIGQKVRNVYAGLVKLFVRRPLRTEIRTDGRTTNRRNTLSDSRGQRKK